jgi:hypothetical protein
MDDIDLSKETARERATRMWRNAHIQRTMGHEPQTYDHTPQGNKLRAHIIKLLTSKNNTTLHNYLISIEMRRRSLLAEKLRRLRAQQESTNE